jgi:superfamily II DNA or RNA helicase
MQLRPYQEKDFHALRGAFRAGSKSVLFVAPTGYGKTVLFSHIAKNAIQRGKRVMILCHRAELIDQIVSSLRAVGLDPEIIAAGHACQDRQLMVASVWTLINRLYAFEPPDLLVVDEAHHATSKTTWGKILNHWKSAHRLGVTATPIRLSGEGLDDLFDSMVLGPSTQDLIELGFLTPVRVFAPSQPDLKGVHKRGGDYAIGELEQALAKSSVTGDAVAHYQRLCSGKRAIAFCVSVEHAKSISTAFNKAGIPSEHIDGSLDSEERKLRIKDFREGRTLVLTSCDLVSEGFDLPAIEVGISLRPTASVGLWLQQVGRCIRTAVGKENAVILDHAGNTHRHGLPTDAREWSLTGAGEKKKRSAQEAVASVRTCKSCFACSPVTSPVCRECGEAFPVKARKLEKREGDLEEIKGQIRQKAAEERRRASSLDGLIALGKMRGYKNPRAWAEHVMRGRQHKRMRFV